MKALRLVDALVATLVHQSAGATARRLERTVHWQWYSLSDSRRCSTGLSSQFFRFQSTSLPGSRGAGLDYLASFYSTARRLAGTQGLTFLACCLAQHLESCTILCNIGKLVYSF